MQKNNSAQVILGDLSEGSRRVKAGQTKKYCYSHQDLLHISRDQIPNPAIVVRAERRVSPEFVFDQPIGSIFASRVHAHVASDRAEWMVDIAVFEFHVPS